MNFMHGQEMQGVCITRGNYRHIYYVARLKNLLKRGGGFEFQRAKLRLAEIFYLNLKVIFPGKCLGLLPYIV